MKKLTDQERERIVDMLREGEMSQGAIAREAGRHVSTVNRIAKAEGIDSNIAAAKKAVEAKGRYGEAERREVLNELMDKGRQLLGSVADAGEYQKLTVGIATTVDKILLTEGKATERSETTRYDGNSDREQRFERLFAQLDTYRAGADEDDGRGDRGVSMDTDSPNNTPT